MRKRYQALVVIEYAFVLFVMASFSVVGVAAFLFGFQMGRWAQWEQALVGATALTAGIIGILLGVRIALVTTSMDLGGRPKRLVGRRNKPFRSLR